jgi:hypothetical protein
MGIWWNRIWQIGRHPSKMGDFCWWALLGLGLNCGWFHVFVVCRYNEKPHWNLSGYCAVNSHHLKVVEIHRNCLLRELTTSLHLCQMKWKVI